MFKIFKIKRNYNISQPYSGWRMLRNITSFNPSKFRYIVYTNKMNTSLKDI